MNFKERLLLLTDLAELSIEYRIYTVDEWRSEKSIWIGELKKRAIKVYP